LLKNFLFAMIFMGLTMYLGYALYERSQLVDDDVAEQRYDDFAEQKGRAFSLPDDMTIVRKDGSSLEIRLKSRTVTEIHFERISDGETFQFSINQLDETTRELVEQYPATMGSIPSRTSAVEDNYVQQLRVAIARIDADLRDMEIKYAASLSKTERRTLRNKAEEMNADRLELEAKIADRQ
jgi:glycogen debranching enzyme